MMEYNQKRELPTKIIPYKDDIKKIINVYGDSFVFLLPSMQNSNAELKSWQYFLSQMLSAEINSYGIPGAAESTILYCYLKTHKKNRDYTIIFHTHPDRSDKFFNLDDLTTEDYESWDKALDNHKVLHIYWNDAKHYIFKNGETMYCYYWMEGYSETIRTHEYWGKSSNYLPSDRRINHMTHSGSFQLALDIYKLIKNE